MNILERAASQRRKTVAAMIVETIERVGSVAGAAKEMGVSKPVLWDWIRDNGYSVATGHWAKVFPPAPTQEPTQETPAPEVRYEPVDE